MPRWVDCKRATFKYGLGDEFINILKVLHTLGLDRTEKVRVKGVEVSPRDVVAAVLPDPATRRPADEGQDLRRPLGDRQGQGRRSRGRRTSTTWSTTSGRWRSTATSAWSGRPRSTRSSRWSCCAAAPGRAPACSARRRSTPCRSSIEASSHGLEQRRLDGVRFSAGAFTNLSRDHLDYHRTLQDYSEPSSGCSIRCCRRAPRRSSMPTSRRRRRSGASPRRASSNLLSVGRSGETLKLVSVTRMHDGVAAAGRGVGREALRRAAARRAFPDLQRAGRRGAGDRDRRRGGEGARRARRPEGRERPAGAGRHASERRAGLRRLRAHARRARQCAAGAPAACRGQARRHLRRRRRPRSRQAAADGRGGARERRPRRSSPTTIRAAKIPPPSARRCSAARPAPRRSATGARRSAPRSPALQAGRHPAHRRQGPRDRPDDRRQGAAVLRPGGGARARWRPSEAPRERALDDRGVRRRGRAAGCEGHAPAGDRRHLDRQPHRRARRGLRRHPRRALRRPRLRRRRRCRPARRSPSCRKGAAPAARARCSSCPTIRSPRWSGSARRRGRACTARSSRSPARSARPAPRRCCAWRSRSSAPTHAPVGSFNNHWGVPLTLARMPAETRYGVFEIGMNHAGEIRPLTKLVRPHVAIVTTVEPVHLAYFDGEAAIAEAKAEIFEGLEPGGDGGPQPRQSTGSTCSPSGRAAHGARIVSFGEHAVRRRSAGARRRCSADGVERAGARSSASRRPTGSARPAGIWCRTRSPCSPPRMRSAPTWRA